MPREGFKCITLRAKAQERLLEYAKLNKIFMNTIFEDLLEQREKTINLANKIKIVPESIRKYYP